MIKPSTIINSLEDDAAILNYRLTSGELIWPLVRHGVITSILNHNNKLDIALSRGEVNKFAFLKTLIISIVKTPFRIKKGCVVFFNSGITNIKTDDDGKYFNRVTDPFYFQFKKGEARMIESTAFKVLQTPRVHNGVYPQFTLTLLAKLKKESTRLGPDESERLFDIISYIENKLSVKEIDFSKGDVKKIVTDNVLKYISSRRLYRSFITSKRPKVIFLEDASYGNNAPILLAAKDNNIKVIELQHGFINNEHIAYNLGSGIADVSEMGRYFPDYFFAYGRFWSNSINIPSTRISIGNPFLTQSVNKFESVGHNSGSDRTILFLSSGVTIKETNDFLTALAPVSQANGYHVIFRPHPSESKSIVERYKAALDLGVTLSTNSALYADIACAGIVIGELSTALFEALAFSNKRCYLLWSSFTQSYLDHPMDMQTIDSDTVGRIFEERGVQTNETQGSYFWETNWESRFQEAMTAIID
ncbi:MAG TPA: hypothetical protein VF141_14375 [Chryseolinea sp.]